MEKNKIMSHGYSHLYSYIKTEYNYARIAKDFELGRLVLKGKNQKVIGLIKDELGWEIMQDFLH